MRPRTTTRAWTRLVRGVPDQRLVRDDRLLALLDPPPADGHWLAEVAGREPAYETADTLHDLCWALSREASALADALNDEAECHAALWEWESAWLTRQRADRMALLSTNLDFERRVSAPLFAGAGAASALRESMLHVLGEAVSLDLIRYVMVCTCDGSGCGHGQEEGW